MWFFFLLHVAVGFLSKEQTPAKEGGGGVRLTAGGGRVTPNWTAGRRETGSPHACPDGRTVEDRVAAREAAPKATGGRRRTGSLQNGRPAGHCQGRPSLTGSPLGPTTLLMLRGGPIWFGRAL